MMIPNIVVAFMVIEQRYGVLVPRRSTSEGDFAICYDILIVIRMF